MSQPGRWMRCRRRAEAAERRQADGGYRALINALTKTAACGLPFLLPFALFALADDGVADSLVGAPDAIHIDIARVYTTIGSLLL